MGVDGIGRGGGLPPGGPGGASGVSAPKAASVERRFEVKTGEVKTDAADRSGAPAKVEGAAPSALERLRAGEIDVHGYVDLKVNEATAHLSGLGKVEIESIRSMLKDQMANDPAVADLVKQATRHTLPEE